MDEWMVSPSKRRSRLRAWRDSNPCVDDGCRSGYRRTQCNRNDDYGCESHGLAQLHQLRGRISRGIHPGYLCVFATGGASPEENARLQALSSTNDGFQLAELDLQMRGPGDLLGTRQHGLPPFRIADLVRDEEFFWKLAMQRRVSSKSIRNCTVTNGVACKNRFYRAMVECSRWAMSPDGVFLMEVLW